MFKKFWREIRLEQNRNDMHIRHVTTCFKSVAGPKRIISNNELAQCYMTRLANWCRVTCDFLFKDFLLRDQKAIAFAERVHQRHLVSDLDSDY